MTMLESVRKATSLVTDARDQATVDLALTYATAIDDDADDLVKLGPLLLGALEALGLSPRSRKAAMTGDKPASPLDDLAARRAGKSGPSDLHATVAGSVGS